MSALVLSLAGCGGDSGDGVRSGNPPTIRVFSLAPTDVAPGDSTLMTYAVDEADSAILIPDNYTLLPPDTGQVWLKPDSLTHYILRAYNVFGVSVDTAVVTLSGTAPRIDTFSAVKDTLLVGDSTLLFWKSQRADSVVVQDVGTFTAADADSGGVTISPQITRSYRAIAFNAVATDTAYTVVRVEVPDSLVSVNGDYYRGTMGGGLTGSQPQIRIVDTAGISLYKPWIHFSLIVGDGTLSADSLQPASNGIAQLGYQFNGSLSYATVRALARDVDSLDLTLRADTIIAGDHGQGQYVRFDDLYQQVLGYYGQPERVDLDPSNEFNYVVYENTLGLDFMVWDNDNNALANYGDEVKGVILAANWPGGKLDGTIGIGSNLSEVRDHYGPEEHIYLDTTQPPAEAYTYDSLGLTFWTLEGDTTVFEIHVVELTSPFAKSAADRHGLATGPRRRPHDLTPQ